MSDRTSPRRTAAQRRARIARAIVRPANVRIPAEAEAKTFDLMTADAVVEFKVQNGLSAPRRLTAQLDAYRLGTAQ